MSKDRDKLSADAVAILEMIADGYSYEQILGARPNLTYLDIFAAAQSALDVIGAADGRYAERLKKIREQHPRAYEKWTEEEEAALMQLVRDGRQVAEIAELLQRQKGAIGSRMVRLGLEQPDPVKQREQA